MNILLVSNDKYFINEITDYCELWDFNIDIIKDIKQAKSYFRNIDYDVLITRIQNIHTDDEEYIKQITENNPATIIIAVLKSEDFHQNSVALNKHIHFYIKEPFELFEFKLVLYKAKTANKLKKNITELTENVKDFYALIQDIEKNESDNRSTRSSDSLKNVIDMMKFKLKKMNDQASYSGMYLVRNPME